MNRLLAKALALRGTGWFTPDRVYGIPFPFAWQGWALFGVLIAGLAGDALLPAGVQQVVGGVEIIGYLCVAFWTSYDR